ncbi:hypothetical protein COT40_02160, partial [Candidatus Peregrinibacteria bacterium CG08_land_8_20_14_0_20_41_10]
KKSSNINQKTPPIKNITSNLFLILFLASFLYLIVGLIKPTAFYRYYQGKITRKKIGLIFGITTFVFFVLFIIATSTNYNKISNNQQPSQQEE